MYLSSRFVLAALPFLALIVNAVPSPVHVPAIGPIRAPTPPMPNPDGHQGQTYVSQQWKEENNKKDPAGKAQGQQEMNAAHPVVQDWQKHNGINQPGGHKQEDHVLKTGVHSSNDPDGEQRPHVTVQRQKPSGPGGPKTNRPKKDSVTTHIIQHPTDPTKHDPSPYGNNENPQTKTKKPHNVKPGVKPKPDALKNWKPKIAKPTTPKVKPDIPAKPASLSSPKVSSSSPKTHSTSSSSSPHSSSSRSKPTVGKKPSSLVGSLLHKIIKRDDAVMAEYIALLRREMVVAKRDAYFDKLYETYF